MAIRPGAVTTGRPVRRRRALLRGLAALILVIGAIVIAFEQKGNSPSGVMSQGGSASQFDGPAGIAIDASGHLFAVDQGNDLIQEFSPSGRWYAQMGKPGKGVSSLDAPSDIAIGPNGVLYVANPGQRLIGMIQFGRQIDEIYRDAGALAIGPQGTVFAPDYLHHVMRKFSPDGSLLATWHIPEIETGRFAYPAGLTVGPDGTIYVADRIHDRIDVLSSGGKLRRSIGLHGKSSGQFNAPTDVALDSSGNIYVADAKNDRIQKLSSAGRPLAVWGSRGSAPGHFIGPDSIALDASGDIYVSDFFNGRVQKLSQQGKPLWAVRGRQSFQQFP